MSFPRYPKYKETAHIWLGNVPGHWQVAPVASRYHVQLGKMLDSNRITGDHLRPYLRVLDVQWGRISTEDLPQMDFNESDRAKFALRVGDLLVNEGGSYPGRSAIWEGRINECYYQKALHRLRPYKPDEDTTSFLYYVMVWATTQGVFVAGGNETTIEHVPAERLRRYRFAFPPFGEQVAIARALDRETAKIDDLVAEQGRLIELLKEKRQAVISHAVTKGLNPDAPMKDSGVPWLGRIPAHWHLRPLKHLVSERVAGPYGASLTKAMYSSAGYRVYGQQQVIGNNFCVGDYYVSDDKYDEMRRYTVSPGDVLVTVMGTIGKVAVVPADVEPGIINPRLVRYRCTSEVRPPFLREVLMSAAHQEYLSFRSQGTTMEGLNMEILGAVPIPTPPLEEQDDILAVATSRAETLHELMADASLAVSLLHERRAALISAAVTGQIDVRSAAARSAA